MENAKILLSSPHMGGGEGKYIQQAFEDNWVAPLGPNVIGFENDLENFLKLGHVAALTTGTAAIHLALILQGVEAGDEVICQSMTFSATANPITYLGAKPIFVDSEEDTWNMSPKLLEIAIKDRLRKGKTPKMIIVVHAYGMPANMKEINEVADGFGIPIMEDAAEALGSHISGQACGTFGEYACLSFNGNKIITTSGGGALVARTKWQKERAVFLATQARDEAPHYEHSEIGYNYRMSNICAGIGRGQMEVLAERVKQRRENHRYYQEQLSHIPGITFLTEPEGYYSNRWLSCILIEPEFGVSREILHDTLQSQGIGCRPLWKPMHMQPVFKDAPFYGDGTAERLFGKGLCLPSGSNLTIDDLNRVANAVKGLFAVEAV